MQEKEEYSYSMLAKLLIVFLIVHLLAVITLILTFSAEHEVASSVVVPVSSVFCSGDSITTRRCYFKNLCYSFQHNDFVFVHGRESVIQGSPPGGIHRGPLLVDLSGGVAGHGNQGYYFTFTQVPEEALRDLNLTSTILPDKIIVAKRFKPDNLMHVFHDDLMPLFFTIAEMEAAGSRDYRLFFVDDFGEGEYWDLYRLFRSKTFLNSHHPLLKSTVRAEGLGDSDADLICFAQALVGGLAKTRWYQYGFGRFQGPVDDVQISGRDIRMFAEFVRTGLEVPRYDIDMPRYESRVRQKNPYAVLFNRKSNRRILNEIDVATEISRNFQLRTVTINLETHSIPQIVHLLENATMLVAMHGAQLILSMFLPPRAILVELFPYGIPAQDYTPFQTLAGFQGLDLIYRAWENKNATKTRTHPEYRTEFGGVRHLSQDEQQKINETVPVPRHFCCQNAAFLYRMYQDTEVDLESFIIVAETAFQERRRILAQIPNVTQAHAVLAPGEVKDIKCSYLSKKHVYHVDWDPPWNLPFLNARNVSYELRMQLSTEGSYAAYWSSDNHTEVPVEDVSHEYYAWVACLVDGISGPLSRVPGKCKIAATGG